MTCTEQRLRRIQVLLKPFIAEDSASPDSEESHGEFDNNAAIDM